MSLINQMLKDLEKRTRSPVKQEAFVGLQVSRSGFRESSSSYWLRMIALGLIILLFFLCIKITIYHFYHAKQNEKPVKNFYSMVPPKTSPIVEHASAAVLTGLTFQVQQGKTDIRLLLSQDTLYRVDYDKENQLLYLFLDHTHAIAPVPNVNLNNSGVTKLQLFNLENGDLKIIIGLTNSVEPVAIDLQNTRTPELQIELAEMNSVKENQLKNSKNVKNYGLIKKPVTSKDSIEEDYQKSLTLIKDGQINEAIAILKEIINKNPSFQPARLSLANLLIQTGYKNEAENVLKQGLQISPNAFDLMEIRARLLADNGKVQEALDLLQKGPMPSLQQNPDYHALIAALYQRTGESYMSAKIYEQLIRMDASKAIWWIGLGIAMEALDKRSEAVQAYTKANETQGLTPELTAFVESKINQYS